MKRLLLAAVVVFLATAPAAARADQPVRVPVTVLPFFTSVCGYFLGVDVVTSNRVDTVYSDGSQTITGHLVLRVTHLDGGSKSIVLGASGPLFFTTNAGGSRMVTGTGNTVWVIDDAVYLVRGQATLVVNPDGTSTFSSTGYIENLCDTLR